MAARRPELRSRPLIETPYRAAVELRPIDEANDAIGYRPSRGVRIGLSALAWFNLLSALAGMAGLTIGGGMGMPTEWLAGTPFRSFFWPGIILGFVVGGVQALALLARRQRLRLTWGLHAAAGLVMMIWIFVELAILNNWSPLHGIYFTTGLLQTVGAVLALGAWPGQIWAREG